MPVKVMPINVKGAVLPLHMLYQDSSEDVRNLLGILTRHDCIPCEGSTGHAAEGDWEEGDIQYYDTTDDKGYTLSYNFYPSEYHVGKLTDYTIRRNDHYDGEFELNHRILHEKLNALADDPCNDRNTLQRVASEFGILLQL